LQKERLALVTLADFADEIVKAAARRLGIVDDVGNFGEPVLGLMFCKLHGVKMEGAVFAVENIGVQIELAERHGINALRVFEKGVAVVAL